MGTTIVTPQFERERGYPAPASPPATPEAWEDLRSMDANALRELGLRPWGGEEDEKRVETPDGRFLWLFPGEWYSSVPSGMEIVNIFFEDATFIPGQTDDDIRFGCLSFGICGPRL